MTSGRLLGLVLHLILKLLYRYEVRGLEHLTRFGPRERVLVVVNHVSFLDGPLLMAVLGDRAVFAINTAMAERWWLKPFRQVANLFPLDPRNPMAVRLIIEQIEAGRACVIFPEGRISVTGALMKIYAGPAMIADRTGAAIVPVRIDGAELTPFSRLTRGQVRRHWFPKIRVTVCPPRRLELPPALRGHRRRDAAKLRLYDIMSDMVFQTTDWGETLFEGLLRARHRHGWSFPALEDLSGQILSYHRLVVAVMALGRHLATITEPGERVGVLLPTTNAAAVVIYALQAFGRVPALLNFTAGIEAMEAAVTTARIKHIISSAEFVRRAELETEAAALGNCAKLLWLEDVRAGIGLPQRLRALAEAVFLARLIHHNHKISRHDPAVVLFTSGSEGRPKAVVLSHGNILANCAQACSRLDFSQLDRCFNAMPSFHTFGLTGGIVLPLLGGVPVFMYPSPLHYKIVPEMIYGTNTTVLFGTNSFFKAYARAADPYDFHSLRHVFAGAEPVQEDTRQLWFEKFGIRILTGYGATETAPLLSINTPMHYKTGTVGRFVPGIEWQLQPVAGLNRGGRLRVRGPNVMLGYMHHDQPGVLVPPEDGWYDTGDIVEVGEEDFVTILGRVKRFAKLGGEMVSLAAVEELATALRPEAGHAAIALPDPRKGERIVLVTTDPALDRTMLLEAARRRGRPEFMVPAEVIPVPELPLLGSGKTNYPAVQQLVSANTDQRTE